MTKPTSYNVASSLFDSMKSFVVLGLCGRTGSGCTEAANILSKDFSDLNLPPPSAAPGGSVQDAEKLILYNYAEKNWVPFYQIKTSSLMTGYLLEEQEPDVFAKDYLLSLFSKNSSVVQDGMDHIQKAFNTFYNKNMTFTVPAYFIEKLKADYGESAERLQKNLFAFLTEKDGWQKLFMSKTVLTGEELLRRTQKEAPYAFRLSDGDEFQFEYAFRDGQCQFIISLRNMQRLLTAYEQNRKSMRPMENDLVYWLLYNYAYHALPEASRELWMQIRQVQRGLPTIIMQDIGINLRTWGKPIVYGDGVQKSIQQDGFLTIAKRINLCLKVLRDYLQKLKEFKDALPSDKKYAASLASLERETQQVMVVIDSIKNPFESMYLKARYSSYYLVAISTDERERRARLEGIPKQLTSAEIKAIDTIELLNEYKKFSRDKSAPDPVSYSSLSIYSLSPLREKLNARLSAILPFIMQNVEGCVEVADIFIYNRTDNQQRLLLKNHLVRYVSLIMNPGLVLPTDIERCMQIAQTAKVSSGCVSRQVGAVLTDANYQVRSIGWNDVPPGRVPCTYRDVFDISRHWSTAAYSDYENDDDDTFQRHLRKMGEQVSRAQRTMANFGKRLPYCFKDIFNSIDRNKNQVHPRSLHGEERAFLNLADQGGSSIRGGYLFTTSSPCELCSKKACYMGISKIYYVEPYVGLSAKHVMSDGKMEQRPVQELFTGALGRAYTYLYTPVLPKKDELELWLGYKLDGSIPPPRQEADTDDETDIDDETDMEVSPSEPSADGTSQSSGGCTAENDKIQVKKGRETCRLFRRREANNPSRDFN